ncbi:MAG: two-component sensor histidine kinase, partial [Cyanobacteria bacterium P01_E01_bin.48]
MPIPSASQRGLFWAARTRILGLYALLIIALVGVSIPIFRQIVVRQVERRVTEDLAEDLEGF